MKEGGMMLCYRHMSINGLSKKVKSQFCYLFGMVQARRKNYSTSCFIALKPATKPEPANRGAMVLKKIRSAMGYNKRSINVPCCMCYLPTSIRKVSSRSWTRPAYNQTYLSCEHAHPKCNGTHPK